MDIRFPPPLTCKSRSSLDLRCVEIGYSRSADRRGPRPGAARLNGRVVKQSCSALVRVANLSSAPNRLVPKSIADGVHGLVQRLAATARVVE